MSDYNTERMDEIAGRAGEPRFRLGEKVRANDRRRPFVGVVDAIYVDFRSACDGGAAHLDWYEIQEPPLKTPQEGRFYSIVLKDGAVMVGEDDLEMATVTVCEKCEENPCRCCRDCGGPCQGH
jgi:hypothetical protein